MNYFEKELERLKNEKTVDVDGLPEKVFWLEETYKRSRLRSVQLLSLLLAVVMLTFMLVYTVGSVVLGTKWINHLFEDEKSSGGFEFVLPLVESPVVPGYGFFTKDDKLLTPSGAAQSVKDSIVSVLTYGTSDGFTSQGTGIIISRDGFIVTNSHVIDHGNAKEINVRFSDGTYSVATIVGTDPSTDIAVIKVDGVDLYPATFGDSSQLFLGDEIIAIGNPAGLLGSVSSGIVSGLGRQITEGGVALYDCIQIDAPINPGNSGGALVDMWGKVVGIVSSKLEDESYDGIGFAISSREAKPVIEDLIERGCVAGRVRIGITFFEITEEMSAEYGQPSGLLIEFIDESCDIINSGLAKGDIITSIDGVKISTDGDVAMILASKYEGDTVSFTYVHDGKEFSSKFKLMPSQITLTPIE